MAHYRTLTIWYARQLAKLGRAREKRPLAKAPTAEGNIPICCKVIMTWSPVAPSRRLRLRRVGGAESAFAFAFAFVFAETRIFRIYGELLKFRVPGVD